MFKGPVAGGSAVHLSYAKKFNVAEVQRTKGAWRGGQRGGRDQTTGPGRPG